MASIFSNLGSFLQTAAAAWLMFELTGSATWVGLMTASGSLPYLILALPAGAVADTVGRTKVLLVAQTVMGLSAATMALVTAVGLATPGRLLTLGLVLGVASAFNLPAWQALVPGLVPRDLVADAVALNSVAFNVARTLGPVLGGLLVATAGAEAGFALNAISYLGVILVIALIHRSMEEELPETGGLANAIALGLRYARYTPPFRAILSLGALFALTSAVVQTVLPNHAAELGGGPIAYGLLLGSMGAGAIVAAFTRRAVVGRMGRRSVPFTMAGFGLAGVAIGAAPDPLVAAPLLAAAGLFWVWTLSTLNATTQLMTPEWVRGRAMSLYTVAFIGIYPVGSIVAGVVADLIGTRAAYVVLSALGVTLAAAATRFRVPSLDEVEPPEFSPDRRASGHIDTAEGGPVMVLNTWIIDEQDYDRLLEVMNQVRLVRLRTGAYRWRLYRDATDPRRLTEVFLTVSWVEHLNQHRRIDDASGELIRLARSYDRSGGPMTRHLVAVDVENPPDWGELVSVHEEYHRTDGSIPIERST